MDKIWRLQLKAPEDFISQFPEYSPVALQLLWSRGLKTQKEIDEFFSPDYDEDLHDPFLFKGMKKAVGRAKKAVQEKEKIMIYGDYDADGVCGSAILYTALKTLTPHVDIYIPDRAKEGYGLNKEAVKEIIKRGFNLIITIDCGIADLEEIKLASEGGLDVLVLDHHLPHDKLSKEAFAIVDAQQKSDRYPFKWLCAAGVAFKFVQAFLKSLQPNQRFGQGWEKWLLDLVAIATSADVVPLQGENRTLVKYGLVVLAQTRRRGLKALMEIAGVKPRLQKSQMSNVNCQLLVSNLDSYTLSYILAPRLNAAGRMDHANTAFELLITDSEEEAKVLAKRLDDRNRERQVLVGKIVEEVEGRLNPNELPKIIIEGNMKWPIGVAGLVAGKLADKYSRPSFIYSQDRKESKGSCRSPESFNVMEAMGSCQDILEDFGGHAKAGGFTVKNKNIDRFRECLLGFAKKTLKKEDLVPKIDIDVELKAEDVDWSLYDELEKFNPFGETNPGPVFLMRDLEVVDFRYVGQNGKHLQLWLKSPIINSQPSKNFRGIYFNVEDGKKDLKIGDSVDVVFELMADEWNGMRELRMKILDLKLC